MSTVVDQLIQKVEAILAQIKSRTIDALKPYTVRKPKPDQLFSCLELFYIQGCTLSYNSFFARRAEGVLETEYEAFEGNQESFLPELREFIEQLRSEVELNEKEGVELFERYEHQLQTFFSDCWKEAGGERSLIPTFFAFEKEYRCRDLISGEVMEEHEAAARLGFVPKP